MLNADQFDSSGSRYTIKCRECSDKYDAITANWCGCMRRVPTLTCPSCLHCFCNAPHDYRLTFWAEAPADFVWRNPLRRQRAAVAADVRRPLVLVVDDDPTMRLLGAAMIRRLGYGVVAAEDGEQGLRLTRDLRPDLVLTDALMPRLDGREMSRLIKNDPTLAETRVVVTSGGQTANHHRAEAMTRFGADEYLAKPFDVDELSDMMEEMIGTPALQYATG